MSASTNGVISAATVGWFLMYSVVPQDAVRNLTSHLNSCMCCTIFYFDYD